MTTYYDFAPSNAGPYSFQPVLDGNPYIVIVTWNVTGQRWYVNLYDVQNNLIVCLPLISSPPVLPIAAIGWANGTVTAATSLPHGQLLNFNATLTVTGCAPSAYNGIVEAFILDEQTFQYPLSADPGMETALGNVAANINLVQGYFTTSTMVYRESTGQFEVTP